MTVTDVNQNRPPLQFRSRILEKIFHGIIGALFLFPFLLFVITIQLPIYLYRYILTKYAAPRFRPNLGNPVAISSQFQALEFLSGSSDNSHKRCAKYDLMAKHVLCGRLQLAELKSLVLERWIHAKLPNGDLRYTEFQQCISSWMGFMFFKPDPNFNVDNHLFHHVLDGNMEPETCEAFLDKLTEDILNEPYHGNQSPWQIHLITGFKSADWRDEQDISVLLLRFHHALAGSSSLTIIIVEGLYGDKIEKVRELSRPPPKTIPAKPETAKPIIKSGDNNFRKFGQMASAPFRFLVQFGFIMSMPWSRPFPRRKNPVVTPPEEKISPKQIYCQSPLIPLDKLKFIKNSFNVTLSSVLMSCVSAAVSKATPQLIQDWDYLRMSLLLPRGGHRNQLNQHLTLPTVCELDIGAHLNPKTRLQLAQKSFLQGKGSFIPKILLPIKDMISGSLAGSCAQVHRFNRLPVGISNYPGPMKTRLDQDRYLMGFDCTLATFADVVFTMVSYEGDMRVNVTSEDHIVTRGQLEEIMRVFCGEIEILHEMAKMNSYHENN